MNKILTTSLVILSALAIQETKAQEEQYSMSEINNRLELVNAKKLHLRDDPNAFSILQEDQDFAAIESKCKTEWSNIIDNFDAIKGGEAAQKLVVSAFQSLDVRDYMSSIEKLVARFESGTVTKLVILEILYPKGRMRAFLADNYANARVAAVLNRIKSKVVGDTELISQIEDIMSGQRKLEFAKFRDAHQDTSEGNIPILMLPE